jgi:hypothetical protein
MTKSQKDKTLPKQGLEVVTPICVDEALISTTNTSKILEKNKMKESTKTQDSSVDIFSVLNAIQPLIGYFDFPKNFDIKFDPNHWRITLLAGGGKERVELHVSKSVTLYTGIANPFMPLPDHVSEPLAFCQAIADNVPDDFYSLAMGEKNNG